MSEPYLILVTANLLRLKRQLDSAETHCNKVLMEEPDNVVAHSILGDIARDRGDYETAVQWYKMALRLEPDNIANHRKLEETNDLLYAKEGKVFVGKLKSDIIGQLETAVAEVKATKLPAAIAWIMAAVFAALVLVTITVIAFGRQGMPTYTVEETPSGAFVTENKFISKQITGGVGNDEKTEPIFGEDLFEIEKGLLEHLASEAGKVDPNCVVEEVEIDPVDGLVAIRLTMPSYWSAETTRYTIMRVVLRLAIAAATFNAKFSTIRLRCYTYREEDEKRLSFQVDAPGKHLSSLPEGAEIQYFTHAFSEDSIWWEEELKLTASRRTLPGAP